MKVGVLLDRFHAGKGGAEAWLERFAAAAAAAGHEPLLVTRDPRDPRGGGAFACWVPVPTGPGPRFFRDRAFARAADRVARAAGAEATLGVRHVRSCDLYQPHGGVHRAALEGTLASLDGAAARSARRAARAVSPKQRALLEFEGALLGVGGAKRVVALSRRVLRDLETHFPAAVGRAVVIPPGVDLERFRPAPPAASGPPRALFLAATPRLKGLGPLLDALARVRRGGLDLRLTAGGGFRPGPWRRRAARLGMESAVDFPGHAADPRPLFAAADFLAHPTFYDPCSLVVLEALASGRPVVTTVANGAAEWVDRGAGRVTGDPRDVEALAEALAETAATAREESTTAAARRSAEAAEGPGRVEEVLALLTAST